MRKLTREQKAKRFILKPYDHLMTRKELRALAEEWGASLYQHGARCSNGHDSPRFTKSGKCRDCRRAAWRRYASRYPLKVRANLEKMLEDMGLMTP